MWKLFLFAVILPIVHGETKYQSRGSSRSSSNIGIGSDNNGSGTSSRGGGSMSSSTWRRLPPLPCRDDFAKVAENYFHRLGRAVEVGVFRGVFSRHNLRSWSGEYTMVDYWAIRKNETKGFASDNWMTFGDKLIAKRNVREFGSRVKQVQALSLKAATFFPSEYFDWIYVDALHTYTAVLADLRAWWPKLRRGGFFSGDDYGDDIGTPLMSAERWAHNYGKVARTHHWGVMRAAQEFADEVDRQLFVTWMKSGLNPATIDKEGTDCYTFPAWYMVK